MSTPSAVFTPLFPISRSAGAYRALSPACHACGVACVHADLNKAQPA
ncbi:hypothetical protein [Komagataeibacter oboediens]|uniref:Uncharacterized protein n=1 Tax=Komagataeibacter oboediens TaxID=65958 RepID=A0ABS5SJT9_9PROT|nr:hypothetical protein [Komagataeibacter oboediens]MBL7233959.1 hypothetical protein [Komagataeibacter oboediens]MBT0674077.1 hypothetical protein [Komagataeibacter oboediens]MBT0677201.1 hypothetical protein [Komagataeibacter oboediens]MBV0887131.1 hypothetical protein [Komagataeibacter oboediens]MBV1823566.1 hypothetical protein [Komagataeibacter oboediens]